MTWSLHCSICETFGFFRNENCENLRRLNRVPTVNGLITNRFSGLQPRASALTCVPAAVFWCHKITSIFPDLYLSNPDLQIWLETVSAGTGLWHYKNLQFSWPSDRIILAVTRHSVSIGLILAGSAHMLRSVVSPGTKMHQAAQNRA